MLRQLLVIARKTNQFDLPGRVFEPALCIQPLVAAALLYAQTLQDPGHLEFIGRVLLPAPAPFRRRAFQRFGDRDHARQVAQLLRILVQRMSGNEESQHFLLVRQAHALFPVGGQRQRVGVGAVRGRFVKQAEQSALPLLRVALRFLRALHCLVDGVAELPAVA